MKTQRYSLLLTGIVLGSAIMACNFSTATLGELEPPPSTLAPPPAAEFQLESDFSNSPYFVEDFDGGIPENFDVDPGWQAAAGILSVTRTDARVEIAGDWQEYSLILLLRVGNGGAAVDYNIAPEGAYRLDISSDVLSLAWLPAEAEPELIITQALDLASGWHNLVLTQKEGRITLAIDGETLLEGLNPAYSPAGYFRLSKTGPGTLEIDRLVIGPPGQGDIP